MLRRLALGTAFALLVGAAPRIVRAASDEAGAGANIEEPTSSAEAAGDSGDDAPAPKASRSRHRRGKLHHGRFSGRVVPEDQLRVDPLARPSGNLKIVSAANPGDMASVNLYN